MFVSNRHGLNFEEANPFGLDFSLFSRSIRRHCPRLFKTYSLVPKESNLTWIMTLTKCSPMTRAY